MAIGICIVTFFKGIRAVFCNGSFSFKTCGNGVSSRKIDCKYRLTAECVGLPRAAKAFNVGLEKTS